MSRFYAIARDAEGNVKLRGLDALKENAPPDVDPDAYLRQALPEMMRRFAEMRERVWDGDEWVPGVEYVWWQLWEGEKLIARSENAPTFKPVLGLVAH